MCRQEQFLSANNLVELLPMRPESDREVADQSEKV